MTCTTNKHCYSTHAAARRVALLAMKRQRGVVLRVYRCTECHTWHMTSTPYLKSYQTLRYLRMRREVTW